MEKLPVILCVVVIFKLPCSHTAVEEEIVFVRHTCTFLVFFIICCMSTHLYYFLQINKNPTENIFKIRYTFVINITRKNC